MSDFLDLLMAPRERPAPPEVIRSFIELVSLHAPRDGVQREIFEEELRLSEQAFRAASKRGLLKSDLNVDLTAPANIVAVVADKLGSQPTIASYLDVCKNVGRRQGKKWLKPLNLKVLEDWLSERGHELELWEMAKVCNVAEIARFAHELPYDGDLVRSLHESPLYKFIEKIALSSEHWGKKKLAWDELVKFHRLLMNFEVGLPGFEVRYDYTMIYHHARGWSEFTGERQSGPEDPKTKPWLDGEIGLIISFAGEHVMTIGVSPSVKGLLVNQVQLLKKRGNRWLYKVPKPYFEHMLQRLLVACEAEGIDMYLVKGESLRDQIKSLYEKLPFDAETGERIRRTYNQRFQSLSGSRSSLTVNGHNYRRLKQKRIRTKPS